MVYGKSASSEFFHLYQALGYKIGAIKIQELRKKYQKSMGNKFNLADFHDQLLKDGPMPLGILEKKMDAWASAY